MLAQGAWDDTQALSDLRARWRLRLEHGHFSHDQSQNHREGVNECQAHLSRTIHMAEKVPGKIIRDITRFFSPSPFLSSQRNHTTTTMASCNAPNDEHVTFDPKSMPFRRLGPAGLRVPLFSLGSCTSRLIASRRVGRISIGFLTSRAHHRCQGWCGSHQSHYQGRF